MAKTITITRTASQKARAVVRDESGMVLDQVVASNSYDAIAMLVIANTELFGLEFVDKFGYLIVNGVVVNA